ncbi:MAG: laccase domain-containing protein, partial [Terriglobales bacterium]
MAIATKQPARKRALHQSKPQLLTAPDLTQFPWLVHGFSIRSGGSSTVYGGRSLNLGFTKDDSRKNVEENRRRLLLAMGAARRTSPWPLVTLRQIHSDQIHVISSPEPESGPLAGDGLTTRLPGVALGILTADCFPVLLVDTKK